MAVRSKTTIFNAALLRTGNEPSVEADNDALWLALEANYDEIVRGCFEEGDGVFSFGRVRRKLTTRVENDFGFDDAFVLPSDAVHISEVYLNDTRASDLLANWEVAGDPPVVLIDAGGAEISVEYVAQGQEHTWSAQFALAVQRRLEAVIKDVLEESNEAAAKEQEAEFALLKAGVKASRNRATRRVWKLGGGRLMRARRGMR